MYFASEAFAYDIAISPARSCFRLFRPGRAEGKMVVVVAITTTNVSTCAGSQPAQMCTCTYDITSAPPPPPPSQSTTRQSSPRPPSVSVCLSSCRRAPRPPVPRCSVNLTTLGFEFVTERTLAPRESALGYCRHPRRTVPRLQGVNRVSEGHPGRLQLYSCNTPTLLNCSGFLF